MPLYNKLSQFLPGLLVKKSRTRGVKIESLKLPSVVDFAVGELVAGVVF